MVRKGEVGKRKVGKAKVKEKYTKKVREATLIQQVKDLISAAELLDGFRAGYIASPSAIEVILFRRYGSRGSIGGVRVSEFSSVLREVYSRLEPEVGKYIERYMKVSKVFNVVFVLLIAWALSLLLVFYIPLPEWLLVLIARYHLLVTLGFAAVFYVLMVLRLYYYPSKIRAIALKVIEKESFKEKLRRLTQAVLDELRKIMRTLPSATNKDYRDFRLRLMHDDYKGLFILKTPSRFRKYYVAIIDPFRE